FKNPRGFSDRDRRPRQGGGYTTAALYRAAVTRPPPLRRRLQNRPPAQGGGFAQNAQEPYLKAFTCIFSICT
ncbi:hypothetical protein KI387_038664, partial [Taxus chinensis]